MKSRLFNILAAVSLVLFLFTIVAWLRSVSLTRFFGHVSRATEGAYVVERCEGVFFVEGNICIVSASLSADPVFEMANGRSILDMDRRGLMTDAPLWACDSRDALTIGGFYFDFNDQLRPLASTPQDTWHLQRQVIQLPIFSLALYTAVLPLLWLAFAISRDLQAHHGRCYPRCPACSYDLRASADRCPECGTVIPAYELPKEAIT